MSVVPDASPLIALSKLGRIGLLAALYGRVIITPWVWIEAVVQGGNLGAADAIVLERLASAKQYRRTRLTALEAEYAGKMAADLGIGNGEAGVLAVARSRQALCVLDDKRARAVALSLRIDCVGTVGVLYEAFVGDLLSYDGLIEALEKAGEVLWLSPDVITRVIRRARVEQGK